MALKISLKPGERVIMGGALIKNGKVKSDFVIQNTVPVLREKDIMGSKEADSPCKRIYFAIQLTYIDEKNIEEHRRTYWKLVKDVVEAAPSTLRLIDKISDHILHERYYQALKLTTKLIEYERGIMNHVRCAAIGSL
jgi:flagellar protein FlbT